jgi:predicted anti-sigma-YlaC factor YlaD
MLPTCRQVAEQLSENLDQNVTGVKWFKLKIHLLMCKYCRQYGKQLDLSSKTINLAEPKVKPSEEFKDKMVQQYKDCHCMKEE